MTAYGTPPVPVGRCHGRTAALLVALLAGWTSLRAAEPDKPIELPPMIVLEDKNARPWRYAAVPGLEVLSRCEDEITSDFIERHQRLDQLLQYLLPGDLQFQTTVPKNIVLVDAASTSSLSQDLVTRFGSGANPTAAGPIRVHMMPNLELDDVDALSVFAIVDRRAFDSTRLIFTPGHVRFLLRRRVPPLPAWFAEGFSRLFAELECRADSIRMPAMTWQSDADSRRLKDDPDAPRAVPPLVDFFASARARPDAAFWLDEAELFIRWSLVTAERRTALWKFAAACATDGESEALFRGCYHIGYTEARDRLSDYLPTAVREDTSFTPDKLPPPPRIDLRDATAAEIGRMKAEWERLETTYVQNRYPQFAAQYRDLAERTVAVARERAPSDPGLLAVAGLIRCDAGKRDDGRPMLEAAAAGQRARPRVYLELAAMRLADGLKSGVAGEGRITPGQAAVVLETLQLAQAQQPAMPDTYGLMAETWYRSGISLKPADLVLFERGLREFPRSPRLLYFGALVCLAHGSVASALQLADEGAALPLPASTHAHFLELKAVLEKALNPSASAKPAP